MGALEVEEGTHTKDVHEFAEMSKTAQDIQLQDTNGDDSKREYLVEDLFATMEVPPWWKQITIRGLIVSALLGILFSIITLKLSL
eukprot:c16482_g1_i1 orf=2-253(-)